MAYTVRGLDGAGADAGASAFAGTVLIIAPHMDDEILACGGLIARLPGDRVHIVFATDGMRSPAPIFPWQGSVPSDLGALRRAESRAAAALLGVPGTNLHFLNLPEAELRRHLPQLEYLLLDCIARIRPDHVLIPFRYDRHQDHLAVHRVVIAGLRAGTIAADVTEYFVYYRSRLLRLRDVRKYVAAENLLYVDIADVASLKRRALDCFTTQTTCYYEWQTRPILRPELLDEECVGPEQFVRFDLRRPGPGIFTHATAWIRIAHRLEPALTRWKYLLKSSAQRLWRRHG